MLGNGELRARVKLLEEQLEGRTRKMQDRDEEVTRLREEILRFREEILRYQGGIDYWARQHRAAREEADRLRNELATMQANRSGIDGQPIAAWCNVAVCQYRYDAHQHLDADLMTEVGLAVRPASIVPSVAPPLTSTGGKSQ